TRRYSARHGPGPRPQPRSTRGRVCVAVCALRVDSRLRWASPLEVQTALQEWQGVSFVRVRSTVRSTSVLGLTMRVERTSANACAKSTSWGSLVRAQYRPLGKGAQTRAFSLFGGLADRAGRSVVEPLRNRREREWLLAGPGRRRSVFVAVTRVRVRRLPLRA